MLTLDARAEMAQVHPITHAVGNTIKRVILILFSVIRFGTYTSVCCCVHSVCVLVVMCMRVWMLAMRACLTTGLATPYADQMDRISPRMLIKVIGYPLVYPRVDICVQPPTELRAHALSNPSSMGRPSLDGMECMRAQFNTRIRGDARACTPSHP